MSISRKSHGESLMSSPSTSRRPARAHPEGRTDHSDLVELRSAHRAGAGAPRHNTLSGSTAGAAGLCGAACDFRREARWGGGAQRGEAERPYLVRNLLDWFVEAGAVVVMEHGHRQLGNEPRRVLGIVGVNAAGHHGLTDFLHEKIGEVLRGSRHLCGVERLKSEML